MASHLYLYFLIVWDQSVFGHPLQDILQMVALNRSSGQFAPDIAVPEELVILSKGVY